MDQEIKEYLITNRDNFVCMVDYYKEAYRLHYKDTPIFNDEIMSELLDLVSRDIIDCITKELACSTEDAKLVLEDLNIQEYLRITPCLTMVQK